MQTDARCSEGMPGASFLSLQDLDEDEKEDSEYYGLSLKIRAAIEAAESDVDTE